MKLSFNVSFIPDTFAVGIKTTAVLLVPNPAPFIACTCDIVRICNVKSR